MLHRFSPDIYGPVTISTLQVLDIFPVLNVNFKVRLPSEGWVLLVGVPTDPLIVQRSVGENSGSLIGPLGANGVKIVEGDWSIPRLWRYNCKKNK